MKCYDCGGKFVKQDYELRMHAIDKDNIINLNDVEWYKCNKCGELLFPEKTLEAIEAVESEL